MVAGSKKSGSARRVHKRTPGGKTVLTFKRKKLGQAKCQLTGAKLSGVPRSKLTKIAKSSRRPTRPFGGVLSPSAMKRVLIARTRFKEDKE